MGEPLADAVVTLRTFRGWEQEDFEFLTDKQGVAIVAPPNMTDGITFYSLYISKPPYAVSGHHGRAAPGNSYNFTLLKGQSVGGLVTDMNHAPVANATVKVRTEPHKDLKLPFGPTSYTFTTSTDQNGRWRQNQIPQKLSHAELQVLHPDFISDSVLKWIDEPATTELIAKTHQRFLKTGINIKGTVTDMDGAPIEGVQLLMGSGYPPPHADVPQTDAAGHFVFKHCSLGEQPVTAWKKGWAPNMQQVDIQNDPAPVNLKLQRGKRLQIRVVDENGNPIEGARVYPQTWRAFESLQLTRTNFQHHFAATDADGVWTWTDAPHEDVTYGVHKQGWRSIRKMPVSFSDTNAKATLHPEIVVAGEVTDTNTGKSINGFKVVPGTGTQFRWSEKRNI
jgi:hypothetical protein